MGLQKFWDCKVDYLRHNLYLLCTMSTCLSLFYNVIHANYLSKYTKGKNLIWVNRSFHESTFIWDSSDSNRYFLRAFKYFVSTLQFYKFMNVGTWVTWNCPPNHLTTHIIVLNASYFEIRNKFYLKIQFQSSLTQFLMAKLRFIEVIK